MSGGFLTFVPFRPRYGSLTCPSGQQAHHIVPDYTLRYGNRADGIAGRKRIPGLPSFRDGPAICLAGHAKSSGSEHHIAHGVDAIISGLGKERAPISQITNAAVAGAVAVKPECAIEILKAVEAQPNLFSSETEGRTNWRYQPSSW